VLLSGTLLFQELVLKDLCAALRLYDAAVSSEVCHPCTEQELFLSRRGPPALWAPSSFELRLRLRFYFVLKAHWTFAEAELERRKKKTRFGF